MVTIATCFRSCPFHAKNQVGPVSPPTATPQGERSRSGATAGQPHKGHMKESKPPSAAYHVGLGSSRTGMSAKPGRNGFGTFANGMRILRKGYISSVVTILMQAGMCHKEISTLSRTKTTNRTQTGSGYVLQALDEASPIPQGGRTGVNTRTPSWIR